MTKEFVRFAKTIGSDGRSGLDLKPLTTRFAPEMVQLYRGIESEDLSSNGLDPKLAQAYIDERKAEKRLEAIEYSMMSLRPVGSFAVFDRLRDTLADEVYEIQGVVVLARESSSLRFQRLFNRRETGTRIFTSWLKANSPEHINPDAVIEAGLTIASNAGVSAVRIAVVQDLKNPSPRLTVVEHSIDPSEHGFVDVDKRTVTIEGKDYDSVLFQHDLN